MERTEPNMQTASKGAQVVWDFRCKRRLLWNVGHVSHSWCSRRGNCRRDRLHQSVCFKHLQTMFAAKNLKTPLGSFGIVLQQTSAMVSEINNVQFFRLVCRCVA